jgi:hypothetical protein
MNVMKILFRFTTMLMAVALGLAFCGCRTRPICILYGVPHTFTPTEIAGRWIGFSNGLRTPDTDLYRLELKPNQTGLLTEVYTVTTSSTTNQETLRYEISRWDITTNNILTCSFPQRDIHAPVIMTSRVTSVRLDALLRNGAGGWKEGIIFWREKDLEEKLKVLRQ